MHEEYNWMWGIACVYEEWWMNEWMKPASGNCCCCSPHSFLVLTSFHTPASFPRAIQWTDKEQPLDMLRQWVIYSFPRFKKICLASKGLVSCVGTAAFVLWNMKAAVSTRTAILCNGKRRYPGLFTNFSYWCGIRTLSRKTCKNMTEFKHMRTADRQIHTLLT